MREPTMSEALFTTGVLVHTIRSPRPVSWEPKADITTFELAQAMPILISHGYDLDLKVAALPAEVARHFVVK